MTTSPTIQPPPRLPVPVANGTKCINCSYDLGGLLSNALCPECATPAEQSLHPGSLRFAGLDFIRSLRSAVRLLLIFAFVRPTIGILFFVAAFFLFATMSAQQPLPAPHAPPPGPTLPAPHQAPQTTPHTTPQTTPHTWPQATPTAPAQIPRYSQTHANWLRASHFALELVKTLIFLATLYAWWLFTRPNPATVNTPFDPKARRASRIVVPIYIGSQILVSTTNLLTQTYTPLPGIVPTSVIAQGLHSMSVKAFSIVALVLMQIFTMLYIKALAIQLHDRGLATFAGTLAWLLPILSTIGMCIFLLGPLAAWILTIIILFMLHARLSGIIRMRTHALTTPSVTPTPYPA